MISKAKIWIQEMIDNPSWGRTENKWDAINEIAGLIDKIEKKDKLIAILEQEKENIKLLERENKALADDNEIKCDEIKKLKKYLDKSYQMLHDYNKAFRNICVNHPKIDKEEWKERIEKDE